jgi:dual-action HEIGH metallo-peptidase
MRHLTKTLSILFVSAVTLVSCQKNLKSSSEEISQAVKDQIYAAGFGTTNIQKVDEGYLVEGDIILTPEYLSTHPASLDLRIPNGEQYHTTNLVTGGAQTITVALSSRLAGKAGYAQALQIMCDRYNAQNLVLQFAPTTGNADIDFTDAHGSYLASSGFPSSTGQVYGTVKVNSQAIGTGTSSTFENYLATIFAHEVGHCIGFRHTDWMDRSFSCGGSPTNEGAGSVGAIWISGTPTGPDSGSWMLACIGSGQNRPFNNNDKTALNALY